MGDIPLYSDVVSIKIQTFSGNFDGVYASVLADYPVLLAYHDVMANDERIQQHYAELPEGSLRWTYQANAFAQ